MHFVCKTITFVFPVPYEMIASEVAELRKGMDLIQSELEKQPNNKTIAVSFSVLCYNCVSLQIGLASVVRVDCA